MGCKEITLKFPTDYSENQLRNKIEKELNIKEFSWQIKRKSLDARKKNRVHWQILVSVSSEHLKGVVSPVPSTLNIPYKKTKEKVIVVGSGPAGFFSAFVLQKAGFDTTLIERGSEVGKRAEGIRKFEETGEFDPINNYAFGEGGAGTFSDGKLTSRSKHILLEREFIISSYIDAGAPESIKYMAYPHLGSDNLKKIIEVLRKQFLDIGGKLLFETFLEDIKIKDGKVCEAITTNGVLEADKFVVASGNSAYETYRMLIDRGIKFRTKNCAIGCRIEHPQEIINKAQWGKKRLRGVKAAEYRLTSSGNGELPVYTFCMCPGGSIIPSAAYSDTNIVNGMSLYDRNGKFSNAACVAGINLNSLNGREMSPVEALDWMECLEKKFYDHTGSFKAPFCTIQNFIEQKEPKGTFETSYPLGLEPAALWDLLPAEVSNSISAGLKDFSKKIKGFNTGIILGLESKSSAPIQVLREKDGFCAGIENLYVVGEGSGWSGGIISSAADGIKAAMHIIKKDLK
ncbi:MAG: NAD(P)/FAD-dependent oxidoreductase [Candidatus Omnitrophica bacterium]|nr:NAD(P)/FAD-dependent oxidoreductase [Candidatus Omnitrophota bacterium]